MKSDAQDAQWRFKWLHPQFRGKGVAEVRAATLEVADAQLVVAHEYAFEDWPALVRALHETGDEYRRTKVASLPANASPSLP